MTATNKRKKTTDGGTMVSEQRAERKNAVWRDGTKVCFWQSPCAACAEYPAAEFSLCDLCWSIAFSGDGATIIGLARKKKITHQQCATMRDNFLAQRKAKTEREVEQDKKRLLKQYGT